MSIDRDEGSKEVHEKVASATDSLQISQAYAKVWDEFNTRIRARHSLITQTQYLNLSTALLGLLLLNPEPLAALDRAPYYAVPFAAAITSALLFVHDLSMNNLIKYMVYCERYFSNFDSYHAITPDPDGKITSSWGYSKVLYRAVQSFCLILVFLIFCAVAFNLGTERNKLSQLEHHAFFWGPAIFAIFLKIASAWLRYSACKFKKLKCPEAKVELSAQQ